MNMLNKCEKYYTPVGRIIVGAFFFLAGVNKFFNLEGIAGYIESVGLPAGMVLAVAAAIFLTLVGGALIAGYRAKWAALLLAGFTLLVSILFHGPNTWAADPSGTQMLMFMKNLAIMGGLLFMSANLSSAYWCPTKPVADQSL